MSYSFINKVYPNFKVNPKIYDDKLYQDINTLDPMNINKHEIVKPFMNKNTPHLYEKLENTTAENVVKSDYSEMLLHMDYVLNNELCREILIKKLNLNCNFLSQDIIELISFILFSYLVIFIIDKMRH
jgi:hypothetical protein